MPEVSVIMAVFNGERHLREAMASILSQTYFDFEFIIVDDGSTDGTREILCGYNDPRIRLVHNETNVGLTRSLNRGLAVSRGEFVARQDADDISHATRLERQVRYLRQHPRVGLIGSGVKLHSQHDGWTGVLRRPATPAEIRWHMLFNNAFAHTTVMFRRELLGKVGGYDEGIACAQDYDLWARMLRCVDGANIQEELATLRLHDASISALREETQRANARRISARIFAELLGAQVPAATHARLWDWSLWEDTYLHRGPVCRSAHDVKALRYLLRASEAFWNRWEGASCDKVPPPCHVARICLTCVPLRGFVHLDQWHLLCHILLQYPFAPFRRRNKMPRRVPAGQSS